MVGALDRPVAIVGALEREVGSPEIFSGSSEVLADTASREALIAALAFDKRAIPSEGGGKACSSPSSVQSENLLGWASSYDKSPIAAASLGRIGAV